MSSILSSPTLSSLAGFGLYKYFKHKKSGGSSDSGTTDTTATATQPTGTDDTTTDTDLPENKTYGDSTSLYRKRNTLGGR